MLFKIYTKNPVQRNIQYTGYFNTLTSENLENYNVNIKFVDERTIKVISDKIFYYAFSQNQIKTNYADSWRTISIRYLSNTVYELTLKKINVRDETSATKIYSKTASRFDFLNKLPTNLRLLKANLDSRINLIPPDEKTLDYLNNQEIDLFSGYLALYVQTAQELTGTKTFNGTSYLIDTYSVTHRGMTYKCNSQQINSGIFTYLFELNREEVNSDNFAKFLNDLASEELFVSAFIGLVSEDLKQGAIAIGPSPSGIVFAHGYVVDIQDLDFTKGISRNLANYVDTQIAFLKVNGEILNICAPTIFIKPLITIGKCLCAFSSVGIENSLFSQIPNFPKNYYFKNLIIADVFSQAQLSKFNVSDYYSNPYAQKQLSFQMLTNYLTKIPDLSKIDNAYGIATKTFASGFNLYGSFLQNKYNEFKAKTTYNSANVSDFAKITDILQGFQNPVIITLPKNNSESATYFQALASVESVEKIFENSLPNNYKNLTGSRLDISAQTINTTSIKFGTNAVTVNGFFKGELGNAITNNEIATINNIKEEDKKTAREGVWLPADENEILSLLSLI